MVSPRELLDAFLALGYHEASSSPLNWLVHRHGKSEPFAIPRLGSCVNITTLRAARVYEPQLNV
jgi:hypothetical protein